MKSRNKGNHDLIIGSVGLVVCLIVYLLTSNYPSPHIGYISAATFPRLLGALIGIFGVVLIIQSIYVKNIIKIQFKNSKIVVAVIAALTLYALTIKYIGFEITTVCFIFFTLYILGMKKISYLILTPIITTLLIEYVFKNILGVALPVGIFSIF